MLDEIEQCFPEVTRFEAKTGHQSKRNLYQLSKRGYKEFKTEPFTPAITWVCLQKERTAGHSGRDARFDTMTPMPQEQTLDLITVDQLLEKVQAMHQQGYRLVQISATRLPDVLELTYSFALDGRVAQFRLHLAEDSPARAEHQLHLLVRFPV